MELRGSRRARDKDQTETAIHHEVSQSNGVLSAPPLTPLTPLPPLSRLYLYALHGCLCELLFTSIWDLCFTRDTRLQGHSSLWALPMYSTALYVIETLRRELLDRNLSLPLRLTVYTLFIYLWEFLWGAGLSLLEACPWDYSGFRYNFKGLVTLEYAVFWAIGAFIAEKYVITNTLRIQLH